LCDQTRTLCGQIDIGDAATEMAADFGAGALHDALKQR
jgi:hypothetical protein